MALALVWRKDEKLADAKTDLVWVKPEEKRRRIPEQCTALSVGRAAEEEEHAPAALVRRVDEGSAVDEPQHKDLRALVVLARSRVAARKRYVREAHLPPVAAVASASGDDAARRRERAALVLGDNARELCHGRDGRRVARHAACDGVRGVCVAQQRRRGDGVPAAGDVRAQRRGAVPHVDAQPAVPVHDLVLRNNLVRERRPEERAAAAVVVVVDVCGALHEAQADCVVCAAGEGVFEGVFGHPRRPRSGRSRSPVRHVATLFCRLLRLLRLGRWKRGNERRSDSLPWRLCRHLVSIFLKNQLIR